MILPAARHRKGKTMGRFSFFDKLLIPTVDDRDEITTGEVEFDYEKCSACSLCVEACPADSILFEEKKPRLKTGVMNECMACGDCVAICPEGAIRLIKSYSFSKYFRTVDHGALQAPRLFEDD
jgi:formate hydrogenlyase subunit 6/NADH:ubiquinone oxidoreductase subunit I